MLIYKDYLSLAGVWYTIRPLSLMKREELTRRFNSLDKTFSIKEQILLDDENGSVLFNISQILKLYDLTIDEFSITELDNFLIRNILLVNFELLQYDNPKEHLVKDDGGNRYDSGDKDLLSLIINSTWGVCDSAGDAMYLINNLPADILLETIRLRSEDLEKMYSSEKDRRKKDSRKLKEELINKAKAKHENNNRQST